MAEAPHHEIQAPEANLPPAAGSPAQRCPPNSAAIALATSGLSKLAQVPAQRFKSLRLSALFLAAGGLVSVLLTAHIGAADVADIVALRIMAYACWLYGGLGLLALCSEKALAENYHSIATLRGLKMQGRHAHALGIVRRLFIGMFLASLPGLVAAALVSTDSSMLRSRLLLIPLCAAYLLSLSIALGALAALAFKLSQKRARAILLVLIVVPSLLHLIHDEVPSVISIYVWAFSQLINWGAIPL